MARNIEIKARVDNLERWISKAKTLADGAPTTLAQDDTFFSCPNGRLKLREFGTGKGELIFYQRPNELGPKESQYLIVETSSPDQMREALTFAYGQVGRVRKTRILFLSGQTRIHLDRVEDLGEFIELEVVLSREETLETGMQIAQGFLTKLGIQEESLVAGAYIDLLLRR
jgi:predicted adenylyl cyclase CyaB